MPQALPERAGFELILAAFVELDICSSVCDVGKSSQEVHRDRRIEMRPVEGQLWEIRTALRMHTTSHLLHTQKVIRSFKAEG